MTRVSKFHLVRNTLSWFIILTLILPPGLVAARPLPEVAQPDALSSADSDTRTAPVAQPVLQTTPEASEPVGDTPVDSPTPPPPATPEPPLSPEPVPPSLDAQYALSPSVVTDTLTTDGGRLQTPDGVVTLDFPARATDVTITLRLATAVPDAEKQLMHAYRWLTFDLEPVQRTPIADLYVDNHLRFRCPVSVTVDLSVFPEGVRPYLLHQTDAEKDVWETVLSDFDPETRQLTAVVDTFSSYSVNGGTDYPDPGGHHLLTNLPNVSTFSGAATYAYPLDLPPGRRGLVPQLSLTYNSSGLNGLLGMVQSSYVGLGWSIGGQMEIVRDVKIYPEGIDNHWDYDNDFKLVMNGTSHILVGPEELPNDAGCRYYAEDAPELLVMRYTAGNYCGYGTGVTAPPNATKEFWEVTAPDGTTYRFGYTTASEQLFAMDTYDPDDWTCDLTTCTHTNTGMMYWHSFEGYAGEAVDFVAYRWSVDMIEDVYSNYIEYGYHEVNDGVAYDRAHYPDWIRYTGNHDHGPSAPILVDFVREARTDLNDNSGGGTHHDDCTYCTWRSMRDLERIDRIRVCVYSGSNVCPSSNIYAEYDLDYEFVDEQWPGAPWVSTSGYGHETTRLRKITRAGWKDGQRYELPATEFFYNRSVYNGQTLPESYAQVYNKALRYPRLLKMTNGYGGLVEFSYTSLQYSQKIYIGGQGYYIWSYVVSAQSNSTGLGQTGTTTYEYTTPCFSVHNNWVNSCRPPQASHNGGVIGFAKTVVKAWGYDAAELARTSYYFHQTANALQGRTYRAQQHNGSTVWQQSDTTWSTTAFFTGGGGTATFARADAVQTTDTSGASAVTRRTEYTYDAYGNITLELQRGDLALSGDERRIERSYHNRDALSSGPWRIGFQWVESVYAGTTVAPGYSNLETQTLWYYDNTNVSNPNAPTLLNQGELKMVGQGIWNWTPHPFAVTHYDYDDWGNVTHATDPNNHTTTTTYDSTYSQFPTEVCRGGLCTSTRYYGVNEDPRSDDFGLFGQVQKTYDSNGEGVTGVLYSYDAFGRLKKVIRPDDTVANPTEEYSYYDGGDKPLTDSWPLFIGKLVRSSSDDYWGGLGGWERQYYDGLGRLVATQRPDADWSSSSTTAHEIESYQVYDALGRVVKQSIPYQVAQYVYATVNGKVVTPYNSPDLSQPQTTTQYDPLGRTTQVTAPDNTAMRLYYNGRASAVVDANNHLKISEVDGLGQLIKVKEFTGATSGAPNWSATPYATTQYVYDALGNLSTVTDHLGNVTTMTYDALGRKLTMNDPDMGAWAYTYDNAGNLKTQTDARGQVLWFGYDALDRLTQKRVGSSTGTVLASYTYDAFSSGSNYGKGYRTGMSDGSGSTTWKYDARGRVTEESKMIDGQTFTTASTYDSMDRVVTATYPDNEVVTTDYNMAHQPIELSTDFQTPDYVSGATYTSQGQVDTLSYGNGLVTNYTYDDTDTTKSFRLQQITVGSWLNMSYQYDNVGNVTQITDVRSGGSETLTFDYDHLDRLEEVSGAYGRVYEYDEVGNLLQKGTDTLAYNDPDHPHAVSHLNGTERYWYDRNGNMTERDVDQKRTALIYNAENRLIKVAPNLAADATVTANRTLYQPQAIKDGDIRANSGSGSSGEFAYTSGGSLSYVTLDLGAVYTVDTVQVWHYANDGRTYHQTKTQVSTDGTTWYTLFDSAVSGEYAETWDGRTYTFTPRSVRYVRDYLNGSTANTGNHWVEIKALDSTKTVTFDYDGDGNRVMRTDGSGGVTRYPGAHFEIRSTDTANYALDFDGVNDYVTIPDSPSNGDFNTQITLEAWVKPDSYPGGGGDGFSCIVTKGGAYYLNIDTTGHLQFYWYNLSTPGYHKSPNVLPTDKWTHVAATYDGSYVRLYENGLEVKRVAVTGSGRTNAYALGIGRYPLSAVRHFNGQIDEVRILNRALLADEIWEDAHSTEYYPTRSGTVGWYHLDENTGATVTDASGYTNNGTRSGATWTPSFEGYATKYYTFGGQRVALRETEIRDATPTRYGVACIDSATGTGYLMYSAESVHTRFASNPPNSQNADHFICVKYSSGWKYDNNGTLYSFTPRDTDILVALVDFSADTVTSLAGQSGTVYSIAKGYASGNLTFKADWWNGATNDGEFGLTGSFFVPNDATDTLTYLHADHLGSASLATNSSGGFVSEMRYYAYGETRSGSMLTDRRFTGQRREAGLSLYDYNARYYDPYLNRFISPDTIIPEYNNPQSLNRYSYVYNNPLKYYDPDGHIALAVGLILLAAGGAGIIDWGVQVKNNMDQGMSFLSATSNASLKHSAETALTVGSATAVVVTTVPAAIVGAGQGLMAAGMIAGGGSGTALGTALWTVGTTTAVAGGTLNSALWTPWTPHGIMTNAQDRALRKLSQDTGECFTICGGYGESAQGIRGRLETWKETPISGQSVPGNGMPSWRQTGVPRGSDVDLWHHPSPEVEQGIRTIFRYQGKFDLYSNYPDWRNHLPYASKTYFPDGSQYQNWAPWNYPE